MNPKNDFRLSKSAKRMISSYVKTGGTRAQWKKAFIQAELALRAAKNAKLREPKGEV